MAARRGGRGRSANSNARPDADASTTPAREDEADIVADLGAHSSDDDPETLVVDEARVLEEGAVDAESIRENRHARDVVDKKRGGVKHIAFNVNDALLKYEELSKLWPVNSMEILLKRMTGSQAQWVISSRPKTGAELYAAIMALHGRREETEYEVKFRDSYRKETRGTARITIPSTLDDLPPPPAPQGQPPMQSYAYPPPPYGSPPPYGQQPSQSLPPALQNQQPLDGNTLLAMQKQMFEMMQQMMQGPRAPVAGPASAPVAPPTASASPDANTLLAMQRQMFEMMQQMQAAVSGQQPPSVQAAPAPAVQAPAPPDQASTLLAMQRQMFEMMQQMQATAAGHPAPAPASAPAVAAAPVVDSTTAMLAMQKQMFEMMLTMLQTVQGANRPSPAAGPYRGPYAGPRPPPYYAAAAAAGQEQPGVAGPPAYGGYPGGPHQQPSAPKTPAEMFREAVSIVRTAANAASEFQSMFPSQQAAQPEAQEQEPDDAPVKVMEVGDFKLVLDKEKGNARMWETGWANMGPILKWVGEQREAIQKASTEREQRKQPPTQQLPPGYVEMTPGYVPPPGYVAIPVDPSQVPQMTAAPPAPYAAPQPQSGLPPPPQQMPPPIMPAQPAPAPAGEPQRTTWGMPTIPGGG